MRDAAAGLLYKYRAGGVRTDWCLIGARAIPALENGFRIQPLNRNHPNPKSPRLSRSLDDLKLSDSNPMKHMQITLQQIDESVWYLEYDSWLSSGSVYFERPIDFRLQSDNSILEWGMQMLGREGDHVMK